MKATVASVRSRLRCIHTYFFYSSENIQFLGRKRSNSKNIPVSPALRKVVENNSQRLRYSITSAVNYRIKQEGLTLVEKVTRLCSDLKNVSSHVFGEHKECKSIAYFKCSPDENVKNFIPSMKECGLLDDVEVCFNRLIVHAYSLITNMDNNAAEQYNSVVCKFISGKRINFSLRGSYQLRCEAAALSFNATGNYYKLIGATNLNFTKRYSEKKLKRKSRPVSKKKRVKALALPDSEYGPDANPEPDLPQDQYEEKKFKLISKLKKDKNEILKIEENTRGQAKNPLWKSERMSRLTASHFGEICKMRKATSCENKIKNMLYTTFSGNESTKYGQEHELSAIKQFEDECIVKVRECGFFIDQEHFFLGCSPDGLIGDDGIIEVKCPKVASKLHPRDAVKQKIIKCATLDENNEMNLKTNHSYYYQVQGQMHITKRNFCIFVIWSPIGMITQKIKKDDHFWQTKMFPKLEEFFQKCFLPELVDPRFTRKLKIRNTERQM